MGVVLYFGGGEVEKFRNILVDEPISVSYLGLQRGDKRLPHHNGAILLDSGAFALNKQESTQFEDAYELAAEYMKFVELNVDKVALIAEFDAKVLELDTIRELRKVYNSSVSKDKFMPVWHPEYGKDELEYLCSAYDIVGVSQEDIHGDESNVPLFNQMISRYGVRLHGVGITSKKLLEAVKWSSVSSTAWLSTTRYGETFVWTGRELKRYPKSYKDRARKTHRTLFVDNGFDYQKIENDDPDELLKLSAWSWSHYIQSLSGNVVTNKGANELMSQSERTISSVNTQSNSGRTAPLNIRQAQPLPIMANKVPDNFNNYSDEELRPIITIRSDSMRICDTCFLKDKCPGFEPNANCLYNIPVEIRTKPQLDALQDALIEMQTHRVLFMKMAEDLSGGYSDPNTSSEIDRLNRLVKAKQDAGKSTFSMTVTATDAAPREGFLQKMLGASATEKVRSLEAPMSADELIKQSELGNILDAEVVED